MRPGVLVDNIEVRQPSLDDVFFSLTGGHIENEDEDEDGAIGSRRSGAALRPAGGPPVDGRSRRGRHELEGVRA